MSTDIDALYKSAKAVLWVEDPDTRAWLEAVWLGLAPTIRVLVAGGREHVSTICGQAVDAGWTHIFGLVDRDFGTSNRHRWALLQPNERVYRLDAHEFENLLLNSNALAGCRFNTGKRTISDIDARLNSSAKTRAFWVACIRFLADTSRAAKVGFPPDPKTITSLADAEAYVNNSDWFARTAHSCPALATPAAITSALQAAYADATTALANGSWRESFPGKEVFHEISAHVHPNKSRIDLIKAVGEWQVANNAVPPQITELRTAILARPT